MIRRAAAHDVDAIVELGIEFAHKTEHIHLLKVSEKRIKDFTGANILNPNIICLVLEVEEKIEGFIWGSIVETYFSDEKVFQEMSFYARDAKGGLALIDALQEEVGKAGINVMILGSKPLFCDLGKIYLHKGYFLLEEHYIKNYIKTGA